MKAFRSLVLTLSLLPFLALAEEDDKRTANTVVLNETGVKNLRIETQEAEETTFEETIFALGQLDVLPGKRAVLSSRISGRAFSVLALPHQQVEEGDELMWVESRQPGDPPPTIMLGAPMSGLISKVDIAVGQPVHPDQVLMEIVDLSTLEATASVPQHLAGKLAVGQKAHIRIATQMDKVIEAKIAHIGAYADNNEGTLEASFHLPNDDLMLRPGMRAEFNIVLSQREGVVTVPRSALQGEAANRFVYVKDFDLEHAFIKTPVQVGQMNDRFVEITNGLFPADEVVTRGAYSLSFAGASSVSLKEALDAAHGHEHAADGGELTPEAKAKMEAEKGAGSGDEHDHDHEEGETSPFWMCVSVVLFVLLLISLATRKQSPDAVTDESVKKEAA